MSSRSRNFRRRTSEDDGDDDDSQSKPPSSTTPKPRKPPQQTPKKLLSFADDEDSDDSPFTRPSKPSSQPSRFAKSSPSSSGHKLTSAKDRAPLPKSSLASNVQPQAGTYTKEALSELRKNTKTLAVSSKPQAEPVVILKGLIKPKSSDNDNNNDNDNGLRDEGSDLGDKGSGYGKEGKKGGEEGLILDKAAIAAIRAKRERLRQAGAVAQDYIALDGGSNHGEVEGLSDEEPEFRGRIAMFGERNDGGRKGVFEDTVDVGLKREVVVSGSDIDDEDEEEKIWEEEQLRKGVGRRTDDGASRVVSNAVPAVQQQNVMYQAAPASYQSSAGGLSIGGVGGSFPGLDVLSISQQAELSTKALHENIRRLKETHGRTTASLTRTDENLSASLLKITELETSLSAAGEKFIFMQKLRDFVSVICDFLQDKAPYIEELESQMQKLHEERAAAIVERRTADGNDEMIEIEAAVNAALAVISRGGNSATMLDAATIAAQAASSASRESRNLPVKLDEFGRDENLQKRMDMTRRAEARRRRKARADSKRLSSMEHDSPNQPIEGESSTDESDSESTAYQSNRDQLLQIADQVFSDASEEYSQLSVVKEKFERWKRDYPSSYNDAYMSLSIPAIFSPYVRLELLKWDPLHEDSDFIDTKWHSLLFDYGIPEDDADANIIPELVEKVAVPILHHQISYCWDMLSTRETEYAVTATSLVFRYVPLSSKALGELVAALRDRLSDAVSELTVPTWNTLVLKAVPNSARIAAYKFGVSVRLMRNICLWNKVLSMAVLEKIALDDLLSGKVLPHLRSIQSNVHDAVTRTERIIASLCGVWSGSSVTGERSLKLQPLVDYLLVLGRILEKKHKSGGMEMGTSGLARRLKKMLVELNEYDHARAISRTFNLKEAL
ncbi:hypothetical protein DCAR_0935000 [Daucus carota subsp. sativus]|uniref:GCF C-terminal domain-containing protein n=1 Tax=Daucus carota subsp. sativus TaxID=79200 RepID=A0A175YG69_DAUCS|nr:PREDICTED: PAX3- and PAX7-binding protein 1 [Daucus carota subsp. sativus]WOH15459.1 hypothetical protein DCAR_0935000 [Daucus carota subsp. sativus]